MLFVYVILPVFVIVIAGCFLQRRAQFDPRPLAASRQVLTGCGPSQKE